MDKGEGDALPDDGIVAEDVTQLVEHIELTGPYRLPDTPDWELVSPAEDLDDAPILIGTLPDEPGIAGMDVGDDTQMFIETQADLARLLPSEERRAEGVASGTLQFDGAVVIDLQMRGAARGPASSRRRRLGSQCTATSRRPMPLMAQNADARATVRSAARLWGSSGPHRCRG